MSQNLSTLTPHMQTYTGFAENWGIFVRIRFLVNLAHVTFTQCVIWVGLSD